MPILRLAAFLLLASTVAARAHGQTTAFVNVNVVPMDSPRVLLTQTIVVTGRVIASLGPAATTPVPEGARVIDGAGAWLAPGLADMHVHLRRDDAELLLYVANGVTTVRELAGEPLYLGWRREIAAGARIGPNLVIASPTIRGVRGRRETAVFFAGAGVMALVVCGLLAALARRGPAAFRRWPAVVLGGLAAAAAGYGAAVTVLPLPDVLVGGGGVAKWHVGSIVEAAHAVRRGAEAYDQVKLYEPLTRRQFAAAMRAARATGVHTVGHVPPTVGLLGALAGGLDELAHAYPVVVEMLATSDTAAAAPGPVRDARCQQRLDVVAALVRRSGATVTTTLVPLPELWQQLTDSAAFLARADLRFRERPLEQLARMRALLRGADSASLMAELALQVRWGDAAVVALARAGVPLVLGTDASPTAALAGFAVHDELRRVVDAGLSPWAALRAATASAGRVAGGAEAWGTIAAGRRADLVLLEADPLAGLAVLARPRGVMVAGRWYDRAQLDSLLAGVIRRRSASQSTNTNSNGQLR